MDWIVPPKNSYAESLTLNVIVFGHRTFKEVINVKPGLKGGARIQEY